MKIHIVQKGDTLWKIAKKYGVNFEELKMMNSQLSNPDMIMPGMKIKVPTGDVPVKKEGPMHHMPVKEAPKAVHPYAEMPPVTLPVVEEVKKEQPKVVSPAVKEMPKPPYVPPTPQIYHPQQEIDVNNYYMVNMAMTQAPQIPPKPVNVLPIIMKPESPESVESPEVHYQAPPIYQQPCPPIIPSCPPPCPPPPCCVPGAPGFPGPGFGYPVQPYGYPTQPYGYPTQQYGYPTQPYGYPVGHPQGVSPAMMPSMPYMPGMESPERVESSPESLDFNFPKHHTAVSPTQYGVQPGVQAPPVGYQEPLGVPYDSSCVPGYPGYDYHSYGYQPYYGMPQTYPVAPSYGQVAPQMQYQQPYMPQGYGMPYSGMQPSYPMYSYGYPRQENDDEGSDY